MTLYFNSTVGPIVFNDEGQSVGGGEWFESPITDQIRAGIARGEIVTINKNVAEKFESINISVSADDADNSEDSDK